jgi:hypothetical protein
MSTVEFTLLLPFLAVMAASLFSLEFLVYRSIGQSYAAFSAARRCAVSGLPGIAPALVRADYRACSMPGFPAVSAQVMEGNPNRCKVAVRDHFSALVPGRSGRLRTQILPGATITVVAAGTAAGMGGDNDR